MEMPAANPFRFDEKKCAGCNLCLEACQVDVFLPNPEKGRRPVAAFPGECWFCGCCVMECPNGALELRHPLMNRVRWVRRSELKPPGG